MNQRGYTIGLGFDPGFANTGVAGVALMPDGRHVCIGVEFVHTEKNKDKRFEHLRVSMDDNARMKHQYERFCDVVEKIQPDVIGVECYTIFESKEYERLRDAASEFTEFLGVSKAGVDLETARAKLDENGLKKLWTAVDAFRVQRGRGDAAKTYGVYSLVCSVAYRYSIPVYVFMPIDLKKAATGKAKASKEDVMVALRSRVEGIDEKVNAKVAGGAQNHVYDAAGHAMLALHEYSKWKRDSGLT